MLQNNFFLSLTIDSNLSTQRYRGTKFKQKCVFKQTMFIQELYFQSIPIPNAKIVNCTRSIFSISIQKKVNTTIIYLWKMNILSQKSNLLILCESNAISSSMSTVWKKRNCNAVQNGCIRTTVHVSFVPFRHQNSAMRQDFQDRSQDFGLR